MLFNSQAFKLITRNRQWFSTLEIIEPQGVRIGNDKMMYAVGIGTIDVEVFNGKQWIASVLNDVLYVPEFGSSCLFSLGAAAARGYKIIMDNFNIRLIMNNRTELVGYKDGDLCTLLIRRLSDNTSMSAMLTERETHSFELWHQRLGHISVEKIKTMMQRKLVDGLRATAEEKIFCEGCVLGSMTRKPHKEVTERRQSVPGEIIHADVCGSFIHPSVGGNRYFICFKDESSGYRKVYFMKTKDEVLRCLKIALTEIKQETGQKKIVHEKTPPYAPQCNGMAERENRTLVEKARAMLHKRNLPRCLWAEAVHTAAYLLNRIPHRKEITKTPYEEWFGRRPTVEHLRIFGCDAYVHIPDQHRRKFDPKARKVIFVGYGPSNKMFRVFNTNKHQVDEVMDVQFNESLQKRLVLIDGEEDSWMQTADKDEDDNTDDKTEKRGPGRPPGSKNKIKVISNPLKMELRSKSTERTGMLAAADPLTEEEALGGANAEKWKEAMLEEISALHMNDTWILTDLPADQKTIQCKWVFEKIDYFETFAPVVRYESVRTLLAIAAVGSLIFLMNCTRPDISFEVSKVAQFAENPGLSHWKTRDKIGIPLMENQHQLIAFCDTDWAEDADSRRSTFGYIMTFCNGPIVWSSRVQKTIALSTVEAEYIALTEDVKEVKWIRQNQVTPTPLFSDNQGAAFLTKTPQHHRRTKHIDIRYHFIRTEQEQAVVSVEYIPSDKQPADMLTKALSSPRHLKCRQMRCMNADKVGSEGVLK
ncbi:Retrovirus-related Pol polyprotein from transposon TNT 1-94 [Trichinella pseudospiralis]|uniref:Retrovirus-related Pol polyprotein from transposon TNT 1-94 n=1 Tax=Trichinella pseudospiralis TaxID=6337 RepID=A0A0V1FB66_TRIPS|nr:Retrovirus-related Pol polyprotein from transposon TNT 1-94 [Trichinella pseudospiralis]